MSDGLRKPMVRLPFNYGELVYHRAKSERVAGMVTGFVVTENRVQVIVTWSDDLRGGTFEHFELTSEFEPNFSQEP